MVDLGNGCICSFSLESINFIFHIYVHIYIYIYIYDPPTNSQSLSLVMVTTVLQLSFVDGRVEYTLTFCRFLKFVDVLTIYPQLIILHILSTTINHTQYLIYLLIYLGYIQ